MASQSVVQGLKAFEGYDQGVFLEWLEALTDVIQCGGNAGQIAEGSLPILGGLMFTLVQASRELAKE